MLETVDRHVDHTVGNGTLSRFRLPVSVTHQLSRYADTSRRIHVHCDQASVFGEHMHLVRPIHRHKLGHRTEPELLQLLSYLR